jgi:hypothetical protein
MLLEHIRQAHPCAELAADAHAGVILEGFDVEADS